jgi:hypothetical protein
VPLHPHLGCKVQEVVSFFFFFFQYWGLNPGS